MDKGYKIRDNTGVYFITFAVVEWVDVFTKKEYAEIVVDSLRYCQKEKGLMIYAWCIMSNHLHLVLAAADGFLLSDIIRDFKKYTAGKILRSIEDNPKESRKNWMLWIFKSAGAKNEKNERYQFWLQDNHPVQLITNAFIDQKIDYIHNNPVTGGIVRAAQEYVYSSAIDYAGGKGLIDIIIA